MAVDKKLKRMFIRDEYLSPADYIKIVDSSIAEEIAKVQYVPARSIKSKSFGKFHIHYKNPIARAY
jgi:hypothetical protein